MQYFCKMCYSVIYVKLVLYEEAHCMAKITARLEMHVLYTSFGLCKKDM